MEGTSITTIVLLCFYVLIDWSYKIVKLVKKSSCFGSSVELSQASSPTKEDQTEKFVDTVLTALGKMTPPQDQLGKIISLLELSRNGQESTSSSSYGQGTSEKV